MASVRLTPSCRWGEVVVLHGLDSAAGSKLNGCLAVVGDYDVSTERFAVTVVTRSGTRKRVKVRPACCVRGQAGSPLLLAAGSTSSVDPNRVTAAFSRFVTKDYPALFDGVGMMGGKAPGLSRPLMMPCVQCPSSGWACLLTGCQPAHAAVVYDARWTSRLQNMPS